jgi:hypothetical protein
VSGFTPLRQLDMGAERLHLASAPFAPFAPRRCWATDGDRALSSAAGAEVDVHWLAGAPARFDNAPAEIPDTLISLELNDGT